MNKLLNKEPDRIEQLVSEKRVKLHLFEPSQRKIWTVVGKTEEHWVDPDGCFCSCPGFYFGSINGKTSCYHLDSIQYAKNQNKFETIIFSDDEFSSFLDGLISDL
ncbi:hypothetical protein OAP30_01145 [Nitrosopumilus sp.]|jgi:predicted nucleic acid-binding Zn finger protein|nr:hypothetical protein [Nitrosopumilus sp.]MDC0228997.1 hypothetical protein [Nitrosopumilus sp.]MDC0242159.1 hypothetical protein [Nitrosopumilus sp.]MDC0638032.1 hypothetical protein [Nitrosopumilus sp.]|tara:strand:+ start:2315 stop:2629 length:315 start_codon:yes stop_codon:yes gene_type:complete